MEIPSICAGLKLKPRDGPRAIACPSSPTALRSLVIRTEPSVFLISRPSIVLDGVSGYLASVGGLSWLDRRRDQLDETPSAEALVEFAGRACYRSWEPGLNPNVQRVRTDSTE